MISLFVTALVMGAVGALHCVGMCGPIAMSLPVVSNNNFSRFISTLLYNAGRVTTYATLGFIVGLAGSGIGLMGYQQALSIGIGIIILLFIFFPSKTFSMNNPVAVFFKQCREWLGALFIKKNYRSVFFIGLLNGLLPCGLVYLAMAGAISTASAFKSSLFMAAFGLGTLPLMWSVTFFGGFVSISIRQKIRKLYPYMMAVMAVLLIVRGLGLNIPYLSPGIHNNHDGMQAISCHD
ncbi:MAG: sulfite exporter TauE/SafE family protein [Bacteroidetes bacterium]|nr:sulfite exporter TauE/SafE family protein [Bacteroidota bacterium]